MNPDIWGSSFWKTIHYTTFSYPIKPNEIDKEFIYSLVAILPCLKNMILYILLLFFIIKIYY